MNVYVNLWWYWGSLLSYPLDIDTDGDYVLFTTVSADAQSNEDILSSKNYYNKKDICEISRCRKAIMRVASFGLKGISWA